MRHLLLIPLLVIFLFGCKSQEVKLAELANECEQFGFTKGTEAYGQCMLTLSQRDIDERARIAKALNDYQDRSIEIQKAYRPKAVRPGSQDNNINCTSTTVGNSVYTDCN